VVYGPTGFTGTLVCETLLRRGARPRLVGRNQARLAALGQRWQLPWRTAALDPPSELRSALEGARVVIACAGPFSTTLAPLRAAAAEVGAHLLDLAGEPAYLARSLEDPTGPAGGQTAVVHAVGFRVAVADCLTWLLARGLGDMDSVEIVSANTHGLPSAGSLRTYQAIAAGGNGCFRLQGGQVIQEGLGAHRRVVTLPAPFGPRAAVSAPAAEGLLVPRSVGAQTSHFYFATLAPAALPVAEQGLPQFQPASLQKSLSHLVAGGEAGPDPEARARSQFAFWIGATSRQGRTRTLTATGADPYGITAELAAECALQAARPTWSGRGVLTPVQAFDPQALLAVLARAGVRWTVQR
jgi:short subunit dehydrogenase-like uncharacterized protein